MKEKNLQTYFSQIVVLLAGLAFMIVLGSAYDLSFSKLVYHGYENSVGQFFAAFGELPASIAFCGAAAMIFFRRGRVRPSWSLLLALGSAALFFAGLFFAIHESMDNVPQLPAWVAVFVNVFVICTASYLMVKHTRQFHSKTVFRYALTIFLVTFFTLLIVNAIKGPWGRVRFNFIYQTGNENYFTPWWVFGSSIKDALKAQGISSHEYHSCPSGHSACGACIYLLVLFPTRSDSTLKSWGRFLIAFLWSAAVCISRVYMGAHYITDTALGVTFFVIVESIFVLLLYKHHHYFNAFWYYLNEHENPISLKRLKEKRK